MNSILPAVPLTSTPLRPAERLPWRDKAWVADWTDFVIVHFSLPPSSLAPHVPYSLDLREGRAWVSLVWFNLRRLRFAGSGPIRRACCRPISDHPFLNVRTYVKPVDGPGICFLAEWIPNRLNVLLGPATYGLPYRLGRFVVAARPHEGTTTLRIDDPTQRAPFALTVALKSLAGAETYAPETLDAFLLERYQAYTFGGDRGRRFRVAHAPWRALRADWVRYDLGFMVDVFPWLREAEYHSAHHCVDCHNVEMGRPHRAVRCGDVAAVVASQPEGAADAPGSLYGHV